jgi:hypothetical protein
VYISLSVSLSLCMCLCLSLCVSPSIYISYIHIYVHIYLTDLASTYEEKCVIFVLLSLALFNLIILSSIHLPANNILSFFFMDE